MRLTTATVLPYLPRIGIGALVIGILLAWWGALHAHTVDGRANERERVADSTIKANAPQLRRTDTAIVRETTTIKRVVRSLQSDTLWRHDTVRIVGDTSPRLAVPLPTVARTDSALRACSALSDDCAQFRASANATMAAQKSKIDALTSQLSAHTHIWNRCGVSAGYGAVWNGGRILPGPTVSASCRVWP